jgi:hypothetical protein
MAKWRGHCTLTDLKISDIWDNISVYDRMYLLEQTSLRMGDNRKDIRIWAHADWDKISRMGFGHFLLKWNNEL